MFSELFVSGIGLKVDIPSDNYLSRLPVVRHLRQAERIGLDAPVTFLVGENGVGKSTLVEAIALSMGFNPEGGTVNFLFSTNDSHSDLYKYITVTKGIRRPRDGYFLRAESFYNASTYIDSDSDTLSGFGGRRLHTLSHGESFMALVQHRFGGDGLYIFDEPEAALSPMRIMELMCHMDAQVKAGSQFVISTHSPMLMAFPGARVLELSDRGICPVDYRQTEHYQVMKNFLDAPERMLRYLLGKGEQ